VLWAIGVLVQRYGYGANGWEWYSNTLQAIAVGYLVTAVALLRLRWSGQVWLCVTLVVGYWVLLAYVPFGGYPAGTLERTANLPRYVDELVLGSARRDHDFTWVISSLGFSATVLLGALAGHLLKSQLTAGRKLVWLTLAGLGCAAAGWLWSYWLPLNRHLWTSSMVLWAGGCSFLLLALAHAVIDVGGSKWWVFPFVVLGANALLAYTYDHLFDRRLSDLFVGELAEQLPPSHGELLRSLGEVGVLWLILWTLYRHRVFLRA
jgi:predicted acyltransferase